MRVTSYSLLAALVSLAGLEYSQCYAEEAARPQHYFPRAVKREVDSALVAKRQDKDQEGGDRFDKVAGITIGLDGILDPNSTPQTTTTPSTDTDRTPDGISFKGHRGTGAPTTTDNPTPTDSSSTDSSSTESSPTESSTTESSTTESSSTESSTTTTETDGLGLLPSLSISIPPLFPGDNKSSTALSLTGSPTQPSASSPTSGSLTTPSSETPSSTESPTTTHPLVDLPDLLPSSPTGPMSIPNFLDPSKASSSTPSSAPSGSPPASTSTGVSSTPPLIPPPLFPSSIEPPASSSGGSSGLPTPTVPSGISPSSSLPTGSGSQVPSTSKTPLVPLPPHPHSSSSSPPPPSTSSPPPSSSPEPTPTTMPEEVPTTTESPRETETHTPVPPVKTDDKTTMFIPTSIVFQPPSTPETSHTSQTDQPPPPIPNVITPPDGGNRVPPNSKLIQLGFKDTLNFDFVATHTSAISQIFGFVPRGVGHGLEINPAKVAMNKLKPYKSSNSDYRVTLALMYIPEDLVDKLSVSLFNPNSRLYNHPDPPVRTIMSALDPSIPITPGDDSKNKGSGSGGGGGDDSDGPNDKEDGGKDKDKDDAGGSGKSSGVRASAVGIGLGVVGGAAIYGAAMFYVARRYRQKRRQHRRTSSLTSGVGEEGSSSGRDSSQASMSDGHNAIPHRGDSQNSGPAGSGRTQPISAPVMSENSLGWN